MGEGLTLDANQVIGKNLKRIRKERKLSLGALSELAGVSKTMLSDIENSKSSPTINTILKIADGLELHYTALLDFPDQITDVVREEDTYVQQANTANYLVRTYFPTTATRSFELFHMEFLGATASTSEGHGKKGGCHEYLYVIEGELNIYTNGEVYKLNAKDAICFDASLEHTYLNPQKDSTKCICINFYPS